MHFIYYGWEPYAFVVLAVVVAAAVYAIYNEGKEP